DVAVRRDHGDRHPGRVLLDPLDDLEPVAVRQPHVREADVEGAGGQFAPGLRKVAGDDSVDVHARKREREQRAYVRLVIDDQRGRPHPVPRSLSTAFQRPGSANAMRKMLPPPSRGWYTSEARLSSHSSREM